MLDERDKLNSFEEKLLSKNKKVLIVNKYVPEGVEYSLPKKDKTMDVVGTAQVNNNKKDTTMTKKEHKLRNLFFVLFAVIGVLGFWMSVSNKNNQKKEEATNNHNMSVLTETKSHTITDQEIENTTTGKKIPYNNPTKSNKNSDVNVGDHVSYKNSLSSKKNRNYNTPLVIKSDDQYGMSGVMRAPMLPIPKNSYVRVYLEQELNSMNITLPITAIAYVDLNYNGKVLIPKQSKIIGKAKSLNGNRVVIDFNYAIFPNGKEFTIRGTSLGDDNMAGVPGQMDYKLASKGGKIFATSLLDATASSLSMTGSSFSSIFAGNMADHTADSMENAIDYGSRNTGMMLNIPINTRFRVVFN